MRFLIGQGMFLVHHLKEAPGALMTRPIQNV